MTIREEVIIRKYIQNLLTESKIHFSKNGYNEFKIYWQADYPGSELHLVATLKIIWCGVFNNTDRFKLSFKERNSMEYHLGCDELNDPNAYGWLLELIRTVFRMHEIMYEHRHRGVET